MLQGKGFKKRRRNYGTINFLYKQIWIRYGDSRMWDKNNHTQNFHYCFQNRHWINNRTHYRAKRKTQWQ